MQEGENSNPVIQVIGLSKKYGRTWALRDVSLQFYPGEVTCVVGPNGAGKTTLLFLLAGVAYPSAGHVTVDGLHRWRDNFKIRQFSTVLPADLIVGEAATPYEYLRFLAQIYRLPRGEFKERVRRMAAALNYEEHLNALWPTLSLGLIKKAGLIAAFLPHARIRILDEPFAGGIDPFGMETLYQWMGEARSRGETIIFSTQVLEQAEQASDRVLLLQNGTIAAQGRPAELITSAGIEPGSPRALARAFVELVERDRKQAGSKKKGLFG